MTKGDMSTLHYYVKKIGGKYRQANFLRTFHIPHSDRSQADRNLVKNLLELEMCVALGTLPQRELMQWLPSGDRKVQFPSVHLNIANPLVQGSFTSASARQISRNLVLDSADPEVRRWPEVRNRQLARKPGQSATRFPYVPLADYAPIFNQGIKENAGVLGELEPFNADLAVPFDDNFWRRGALQQCENAISQHLDRHVPLAKPLGNLASRIAIILSGVETFRSGNRSMESPTPSNHDEFIPYGIRQMGLNDGNTLMWPFNLRQSSIFRPDEMSTEVAAIEAAHFTDYSLSLIAASSARFVLICDEIGQRYLFDEAQGLSPPIEIILRGYNVALRLMLDGTQIQRVFIVIPDPKKFIRGGDWRSIQKFAQIMRLATILTNMDHIDHNFFENNRACGCIFRALTEEKSSGKPLTIEQLDPGTRQYLARKGFQTNEDIEELGKLAGSLATGLLVLVLTLPQHPRGKVGHTRTRPRQKQTFQGPKYSKELLAAVRKLREEKVQKNFNCTNPEEDCHDKVPVVTRINVSQQSSNQPADASDGQEDRDDESDDNPEESSDKPASIMEISLDTTDESEIAITEVYNVIDSEQPDESKIAAEQKGSHYQEWLLHKLYNGGSFNTHKLFNRNQYAIAVYKHFIFIRVPIDINLDPERSATVKVELADRSTELPEVKIFAGNVKASNIARRLGISVTVFTQNGSQVQFWARTESEKAAGHVHDLVVALEDFLEKKAIESSY